MFKDNSANLLLPHHKAQLLILCCCFFDINNPSSSLLEALYPLEESPLCPFPQSLARLQLLFILSFARDSSLHVGVPLRCVSEKDSLTANAQAHTHTQAFGDPLPRESQAVATHVLTVADYCATSGHNEMYS